MSHVVAVRTREIGLRMALGAQLFDVQKLILKQGMFLAATGSLAGLVIALGGARMMKSLLYGVSTSDPITFSCVALLLIFIAFLACWIPARRASRVESMIALRRNNPVWKPPNVQCPRSNVEVSMHFRGACGFLLLNSCFVLCFVSRAFVREDVDPPERSGRKRSASGLPPGATNYITARGAKRLRDELNKLRATNASSERLIELKQILTSVHVVDPPSAPSNSVTFGATVTVKHKEGTTDTFTIVGVDELNFERDGVSWISSVGKALLAADIGDWVKLDDGRSAKVVKIEFQSHSDE